MFGPTKLYEREANGKRSQYYSAKPFGRAVAGSTWRVRRRALDVAQADGARFGVDADLRVLQVERPAVGAPSARLEVDVLGEDEPAALRQLAEEVERAEHAVERTLARGPAALDAHRRPRVAHHGARRHEAGPHLHRHGHHVARARPIRAAPSREERRPAAHAAHRSVHDGAGALRAADVALDRVAVDAEPRVAPMAELALLGSGAARELRAVDVAAKAARPPPRPARPVACGPMHPGDQLSVRGRRGADAIERSGGVDNVLVAKARRLLQAKGKPLLLAFREGANAPNGCRHATFEQSAAHARRRAGGLEDTEAALRIDMLEQLPGCIELAQQLGIGR